jgi:hypothetical protein
VANVQILKMAKKRKSWWWGRDLSVCMLGRFPDVCASNIARHVLYWSRISLSLLATFLYYYLFIYLYIAALIKNFIV